MSAGPRARDCPTPRPRALPGPPRGPLRFPTAAGDRGAAPTPPRPAPSASPRPARSPRPDSIKAAKTRGPLRLHACFLPREGRTQGSGWEGPGGVGGAREAGWAGSRACGLGIRESLWAWLGHVGGVYGHLGGI